MSTRIRTKRLNTEPVLKDNVAVQNPRDELRRELRRARVSINYGRKTISETNAMIKDVLGKLKNGTLDRQAFKNGKWVENGVEDKRSGRISVFIFKQERGFQKARLAELRYAEQKASKIEKAIIKMDDDAAKAKKRQRGPFRRGR